MTETERPQTRFEALDALRGIAAVAVALFHFRLKADFAYPWLSPSGYLAVDFFFCLSGFVIAHTYDERFRRGLSPLAFLRRRIIRFYPFYVLGTLVGLCAWIVETREGLIPYVSAARMTWALFLNAWFLPALSASRGWVFPFDYAAWSLFLELCINALYAAIYPLMQRRVLLGLIAFFALILIAISYRYGTIGMTLQHCGLPGFCRAGFSFFLGIYLRHRWTPSSRTSCNFRQLALLLAFAMCIAVPSTWTQIYEFVFIFCISPAIVFNAASLRGDAAYGAASLQSLGAASYGFYAVHMPAIELFFVLFPSPRTTPAHDLLLLCEAALLICFLVMVTTMFAKRIEQPFQDLLLNGWRPRQKT